MEKEEFKSKLEDLIKEFNKNGDWDIFIIAFNDKIKSSFYTGYGCPGCLVEYIIDMKDKGAFAHQRQVH